MRRKADKDNALPEAMTLNPLVAAADQDCRTNEGGIPAQLFRPGHAIRYGSFTECIATWTNLPEDERGHCFIALSEAVNGLSFLNPDDLKELAIR